MSILPNGTGKINVGQPALNTHVSDFLKTITEPGQVLEIRIFNTHNGTVSGYFDDPDKLATAVLTWYGKAPGIYWTFNPVKPALLARAQNRLVTRAKTTTSDSDILQRNWFFIDVDAVRPSGIAATEEEHKAALDLAASVRDWLAGEGWPSPVEMDSGNGGYLLYRIDLPNDAASTDLVKSCLAALDFKFPNESAKVDCSTSNPARLARLPGTMNRKGDEMEERRHRPCRLLSVPNPLVKVPGDLLQQLATFAPSVQEQYSPHVDNGQVQEFDLERWLAEHNLPVVSSGPWKGSGYRWILNPCPWNEEHTNRAAFIVRWPNGVIGAGCHHNGCQGKGWQDLREIFEPGRRDRGNRANFAKPRPSLNGQHSALPILTAPDLIAKHPERRPPVIDGLLRRGETMNVIAAPKVGKSWLTLGLAFAVSLGTPWFGFATHKGRVLIIDNELHIETSAHRLRVLADKLAIPHGDLARIDICNLRGRLQNLDDLGESLLAIPRGTYSLIVIDAFYRVIPKGTDENNNGTMAHLYNSLDAYAEALDSGFGLVHHSSKGDQSSKTVTDVGAGAGAQSRATDTHLILRAHQEDNTVVLDAAVRSWPPVSPFCLRWEFPTWTPALDLDPFALRRAYQNRNKAHTRTNEPPKPVDPPWNAERFAKAFGKPEPRPKDAVIDDARALLSDSKAKDLCKAAIAKGLLYAWREGGANTPMMVSTFPPPPKTEAEPTAKAKPRGGPRGPKK